MTLEADLYAKLGPLCSNRVYPLTAPRGATMPYVLYQQVGGDSIGLYAGEVASRHIVRMQIRVWGSTHASAIALARQVEDAIIGWQQKAGSSTGKDTAAIGGIKVEQDEDQELYGTRQDFYLAY